MLRTDNILGKIKRKNTGRHNTQKLKIEQHEVWWTQLKSCLTLEEMWAVSAPLVPFILLLNDTNMWLVPTLFHEAKHLDSIKTCNWHHVFDSQHICYGFQQSDNSPSLVPLFVWGRCRTGRKKNIARSFNLPFCYIY